MTRNILDSSPSYHGYTCRCMCQLVDATDQCRNKQKPEHVGAVIIPEVVRTNTQLAAAVPALKHSTGRQVIFSPTSQSQRITKNR